MRQLEVMRAVMGNEYTILPGLKSSENLSTIIGRPYKCRFVITKKR